MFSFLAVFLQKPRKPGMAESLQGCVGNHKSSPLFALSFLDSAQWVRPSHQCDFRQVPTVQKKNYSFPMDAVLTEARVHLYMVTLQLSTYCLAETVVWSGRKGDPTENISGCEFLFTLLISVSGVISGVVTLITREWQLHSFESKYTFTRVPKRTQLRHNTNTDHIKK